MQQGKEAVNGIPNEVRYIFPKIDQKRNECPGVENQVEDEKRFSESEEVLNEDQVSRT
jgi:hypothetical protein